MSIECLVRKRAAHALLLEKKQERAAALRYKLSVKAAASYMILERNKGTIHSELADAAHDTKP